MEYLIVIGILIVCGMGAMFIAQSRGATNVATWFLVGLLLGPFGVFIAAAGAKPPGTPSTTNRTHQAVFTVVAVGIAVAGVWFYTNS